MIEKVESVTYKTNLIFIERIYVERIQKVKIQELQGNNWKNNGFIEMCSI